MGSFDDVLWESNPEAPTMRDRMSGRYYPYVPDKLTQTSVPLSVEAVKACEQTAIALVRLDSRAKYTSVVEPLTRMLLRSEAVSSSRIEGLEMNARRVLELEALDEIGVSHRFDSAEVEVLGNIRAMRESVDVVAQKERITLEDICMIHEALLRDTRLSDYGGKIRDTQNWIGGSWYNPLGAAYVPPAPERVLGLMGDLVTFVNESTLPVVATAAIAHAQFETIHPFADGNGRCGRALIHIILKRGGLTTHTLVPVSPLLLTMKEQYVTALSDFRFDSNNSLESNRSACISQWVEFFCFVLEQACARADAFEEEVEAIRNRWQKIVLPRANSAAQLLLDALLGTPVVSVESAARLTGRSYTAARGAVRTLKERGVLVQRSKNKKSGLFVAQELIDAFSRYERSLATASGNTRIERPSRRVPQRTP